MVGVLVTKATSYTPNIKMITLCIRRRLVPHKKSMKSKKRTYTQECNTLHIKMEKSPTSWAQCALFLDVLTTQYTNHYSTSTWTNLQRGQVAFLEKTLTESTGNLQMPAGVFYYVHTSDITFYVFENLFEYLLTRLKTLTTSRRRKGKVIVLWPSHTNQARSRITSYNMHTTSYNMHTSSHTRAHTHTSPYRIYTLFWVFFKPS